MHSILHILNTSTELMSAVELMSGAKSRKWVHQKPTNQPTKRYLFHSVESTKSCKHFLVLASQYLSSSCLVYVSHLQE